MRITSILAFALCVAAPSLASAQSLTGRAEVVDGDTIGIEGVSERIRLYGIDAPESGQTCDSATGQRYLCGSMSAQMLQTLIGRNGIVTCEVIDTDRYGRSVAECATSTYNLNDAMIRSGWAVHYEQYSDGRYADADVVARSDRAGMWEGAFVSPWDWRKGDRLPSEIAAVVSAPGGPPSASCMIKGNISDSGQIYHMPGDQNYERTRIDEADGERWFCSEDEAVSAGWRKARR